MARDVQSNNSNAWVGVTTKSESGSGEPVTDILVVDKQTGDHTHKGYSLNSGKEVYSSYKSGKSNPKK